MQSPDYSVHQTDGAAIGENPAFEAKWSRFARTMWFCLAVFVVLGGIGVFGKGPLAKKSVGTAQDPMRLRYERFARFETLSTVRIFITPKARLDNNLVRVFISASLVKTLNPQKLNPHPYATQLAEGGEILEYMAEPGANLEIDLAQTFASSGVVHGRISLPGQMDIPIRQIVYP